jgi:TRAP-type C4-dicarboxylate transport system permease small subunit
VASGEPDNDGWARAHRALARIALGGSWVCGALLLAVSFLVLFEVLGRNYFDLRWAGAEEIAGYVFAISIAWGFALCLFERNHIRLDFLYTRMRATTRRIWDVLSLFSFTAFGGFLAWKAWLTWEESWSFESTSTTSLHVPLAIPQALWALGLTFFALASGFLAIHALVLIARRRIAAVDRIAGIPNSAPPNGSD